MQQQFPNTTAKLIRIFVRAVIFLQPNHDRLGLSPHAAPLVFVDALEGIIGPTLARPLENGIFLQHLFIEELLDQDGEVLGLVGTKPLARGDEMAFHDILPLGDLGNRGSILLDLLVLEEVGREGGADIDMDLVLGLESGGHLLVDDLFGNGGGGGVGILGEELLGGFHGEG